MTEKENQREKIAEDIRQYLASGGQVTKIKRGPISARQKRKTT